MKQRILWLCAAILFLPCLAQAKIFLADTDDTLRVVTASGVSTIHMYASWADITTSALTPGSSTARVTTATTTVLVAAPAASTQRQIKGLTVRNNHASSSNVITVQFFDGTNPTELIQYTLLAGETLEWGEDENFRVIDASGQIKSVVTANAGTNLNTSSLLTTTAHDAAFGTAGSPDTQVRSIQGISSGTPVGVQSNGQNLATAALQDGIIKDGTGDTTQANVSGGRLQVENYNANLAADNSTLSTSKVPVLPGTVSTSAPTWTNGNQSALSLQTDGSVRAAVTNTVAITANSSINNAQMNGSTIQVASNSLNTTGAGLQATAMVGQCDDTSPTSLTENQFGHARINCTTHHQLVEVGAALPAGTNTIGNVGTLPVTSGGTTPCYFPSAASTNAQSCKASAGQLYGYDLINTTTTIYYLRLYNLAAAPTCSSSTGFVRTIPIPPAGAAGQAGGIARSLPFGEAYGTGIAYCITGGGGSTDNTNAATGVYVSLNYK